MTGSTTLIDGTDAQDASVLCKPLQVGPFILQHRLVMALMVRFHNDSNLEGMNHVPRPLTLAKINEY